VANRIDRTELSLIASAMGFGASVITGMTTIGGTTTMPLRAGTG